MKCGDVPLTGIRAVGALAAAGSSTGTVTLTSSTAPNTCRVLACAHDTNVVKEVNETNNCAVARRAASSGDVPRSER